MLAVTTMKKARSMPARQCVVIVTLAMVALFSIFGSSARAGDFGLEPGTFQADTFKSDGTPETQAAIHPFRASTTFRINEATGGPRPISGYIRDISVRLPRGFIGNPQAAVKCSRADFDALVADNGRCPTASQVGVAVTDQLFPGGTPLAPRFPVYNLVPKPGQAADLGIPVLPVPVHVVATIDAAGDYRLRADVTKMSQGLPVFGSTMTLWGVPGDAAHDGDRACGDASLGDCTTPVERRPFLTNISECGGPTTSTIAVDSWENPGVWSTASYTPADPIQGCDRLRFQPSANVQPTARAADAPTGLNVDLTFPQNDDPDGLATPPLKRAVVTLPEGMTINPASADGLVACDDAQLRLGSDAPLACPEASKIGTASATTPLLTERLTGGVYLRPQASDDPESGQMFRVALALESKERGIAIRLPGEIRVDRNTGRIVTTFDNNPQLPAEHIQLQFKGGARAPLVMPQTCGPKAIQAELTSWSGQRVELAPTFDVECSAGLGSFSPGFTAGTVTPVAGASSPFGLRISKPDGNSDVNGLTLRMPDGLLANLKGNLGQRVGTARVAAGPGSSPFWLSGPVVLEGAHGDAPFSLRVTVPAVAGPFNLGEVVVRQKIYVDPETARVTVVSDPLPTIVKGVPVRLQHLVVDVDKPGFMINPTSCAASEVAGTLASVAGQTAAVTARFQVGECASLGYEPELSMKMIGKGQTKDGSHPALHARLVPPAGNANTKKTTVTLPLSLALDPGNANGLCEPADAARNACPEKSIVGSAQAESVLPDTLKGPVYFVRGERVENGRVRKTLPKLFIPLSANGVTVNVRASSDVEDDRLVTTFDNLPDAPFSSFDLNINGGKHGILAVSNTNTCAVTNVADAEFGGQNGKSYASKVTIGTPCALGIVKSSRTSTALKVTVGGLGAGKVSASGKGVSRSSRSLTSATTATLSLKLAKATRGALARGRDVKVKVKVAFTAKGTKKAKTATKTVVIHGAKKR